METIKREPDVAGTYFDQGIAKSLLGEYSAAIANYNKAIQLKPDYANAYSSRGSAKARLCQYDAAIADYTQAICLEPNNAETYKNRGIAKENLGEHSAAIQDYDMAIRLKFNYAPAYIHRGYARAILGWTEKGKQDLRTALKFAEQAGNDILKDKIELDLQRFEEWVALERQSKGTSMTFEEVQREFSTTLTSERTGEIQNPGRLDFELVEVDRISR